MSEIEGTETTNPEGDEATSSLDDVMAKFDTDARAQKEASERGEAAKAAEPAPAAEAASASEAAPAAAEAPSAPQTYVVQPGDSLSAISQKMYGDAKHWDTIFEHNKDKISDPNMIHPGQELVIP
ncbi:MAG: LysM peptidoglycan-binding domain-containing protein [Tepidiformaceae bacterium]